MDVYVIWILLFASGLNSVSGASHQIYDEVYVSKYRGVETSTKLCGSKDFPCKSLHLGFDVLAPGGHLHVDGEATKLDPYSCQSSGGKLLVQKGFTMLSYIKTAHVSCSNGIRIQPDNFMKINVTGVVFEKTSIRIDDAATAVFKDCVFTEASPAIKYSLSRIMQGIKNHLTIEKSVFHKNMRCIEVRSKSAGKRNQIRMKIQDTLFDGNRKFRSNGLIFINHGSGVGSLTLFWKNVTLNNNSYKSKNYYGNKQSCHDEIVDSKCAEDYSVKCNLESDPIANSFLVVYACAANMTFVETKSKNNVNMRFLGIRSCQSYLSFYNSSFNGHNIDNPGGVVYIPGGRNVDVIFQDSKFFKNQAAIGGVLQIDEGRTQAINLTVINCSFIYCFGKKTGCVLSIGAIIGPRRLPVDVGQAALLVENSTFFKCFKMCKKGACQKQFGPICLNTSAQNAKAVIRNSEFIENKNFKGSAVNIVCNGTRAGGSLLVLVSSSKFVQNTAYHQQGTLVVIVNKPSLMTVSSLQVVNSVFVKNNGLSIKVDSVQNITFQNITCNKTKGLCFRYFIGRENKTMTQGLNATLLIENSIFARNFYCLMFNFVQAHVLSITIRDTKIIENERPNIFVMTIGNNRRKVAVIQAFVLLEHVIFASNKRPQYNSKMNDRKKKKGAKRSFMIGIVIPKPHNGSIKVLFRHCILKDNDQLEPNVPNNEIPTMMFLRSPEDFEKSKGLVGKRRKPKFPSYRYVNSITFDGVTFENNRASTFLMYVTNGKTIFRNCLFKNNFSHRPKIGAHVYIEKGTASLMMHNSTFIQTKVRSEDQAKSKEKDDLLTMSFVIASASGPLLLRNSTFIMDIAERMIPYFKIQTEGFVFIDNNTRLICPVGSYMSLENGSHIIYLGPGNGSSINSTNMKFSCKTCGVGKYSIQRGSVQGTHLKDIHCFEFCPYGAKCTNNIESRTNFFGYKTEENPPQLNFTRCPEQYCHSPKPSYAVSVYNRCHGNRTGIMCGSCQKGFTESIFNHKCRPTNECNDGWFWVIAGLYIVAIAFYILKRPPLVRFLVNKLCWFRVKATESGLESDSKHDGHGYSKIIFYFYQVADLLMIDSVKEILKRKFILSTVVAIFNFEVEAADSSFGCPFPGLNAVTKELFRSSKVFVVMIIVLILYLFFSFICFILKKRRPLFAPYIAAIVEILLLGYERLGHTSLSLLNCTPLKINGSTEWRLFLDGNITCWVHWWQYALIAYNIIFVVPFLVVLLIGTTKLRHKRISPWMFVAACFVPLPFLVWWSFQYIANFIKNNNDNPALQDDEIRHVLLDVLQGPFRQPDNQSRGALYWESILIGRRLVLLCIVSFVATPMIRFLLMTVFCIIALFHNTLVNPYQGNKVNAFALLIHGMLVALATVNLCKSVLDTIGVPPVGPVEIQIREMKIFEVILIGLLPGLLVLLIIGVVVSQVVRLLIILGRRIKGHFLQDSTSGNAELPRVGEDNFYVDDEE